MNSRDDRAGDCFHKEFSGGVPYQGFCVKARVIGDGHTEYLQSFRVKRLTWLGCSDINIRLAVKHQKLLPYAPSPRMPSRWPPIAPPPSSVGTSSNPSKVRPTLSSRSTSTSDSPLWPPRKPPAKAASGHPRHPGGDASGKSPPQGAFPVPTA